MTMPHDDVRNSPIDSGMAAPIDPQIVEQQMLASDATASDQTSGNTAGKLLQSKTAVLVTLFCVTGFLGIPLLWINKRFSSVERILWTVVVCLYSLSLIAGTVAIVRWAYAQISGV